MQLVSLSMSNAAAAPASAAAAISAAASSSLDPLSKLPPCSAFGSCVFPRQNSPRPAAPAAAFFWGVDKPDKLELEQICNEDEFNRAVDQGNKAVVIEWMASWCRKCIYLKPKLETLAADFHQNSKFYFVDVNAVPKALVERGGVTKMPTIQLWRDGEKKDEVIGGHKAWLVMDQVRDMLKNKSNR